MVILDCWLINCVKKKFWTVSDRVRYTVLVGLKIDPWRRDGSVHIPSTLRFFYAHFWIFRLYLWTFDLYTRLFSPTFLQFSNRVMFFQLFEENVTFLARKSICIDHTCTSSWPKCCTTSTCLNWLLKNRAISRDASSGSNGLPGWSAVAWRL